MGWHESWTWDLDIHCVCLDGGMSVADRQVKFGTCKVRTSSHSEHFLSKSEHRLEGEVGDRPVGNAVSLARIIIQALCHSRVLRNYDTFCSGPAHGSTPPRSSIIIVHTSLSSLIASLLHLSFNAASRSLVDSARRGLI